VERRGGKGKKRERRISALTLPIPLARRAEEETREERGKGKKNGLKDDK